MTVLAGTFATEIDTIERSEVNSPFFDLPKRYNGFLMLAESRMGNFLSRIALCYSDKVNLAISSEVPFDVLLCKVRWPTLE